MLVLLIIVFFLPSNFNPVIILYYLDDILPLKVHNTNIQTFPQYTGLWLEIERYPQPFQFGTCDRAYYSAGDGNVIVRNSLVFNESISEQLGTAVPAADNTGLLDVTFDVNGGEFQELQNGLQKL